MNKKAILFCGHGSRDIDAVNAFNVLAHKLQLAYPERLFASGFLEFAKPTIDEAFSQLKQAGASEVIALPAMLMAAGHAKNDIPSEINALQAQNPAIKITYGRDLGIQSCLLKLAKIRIQAVEPKTSEYDRKQTLLCVVGRGASDADANSNIHKITRMLWEGMGFGWAETAYSGVTRPSVAEALAKIAYLPYQHIVLFPYFLFTGKLMKEKIYQPADDFAKQYKNIKLYKASWLDAHALTVDAFKTRIQDAEQGTGNMNCQLCHYREQIIGYEDRMGLPQQGHHHHVRGIGTDADHVHDDHHHHHHHHGRNPLPIES